ncbi:MAG: hypothetical protein KAI17_21840, partial [Thiotrichaceae bacterium]|nr:hypothetical protein [Thiotrichaceae bacterium]
MFLKNKYYLLILCALLSLGYAAVSFSDDCTELTTLSQYGVIGQADFNAGNDSTINNNNITGSGNTPTPTGTSETINETFPPIDPAVFPATGGDDIDVSNEAISVAADGYSKITFEAGNNNKTIIFTGGNYYIEELNLKKNNAVIQLAPGDYFIEKLNMDNKTNIILSGNGPVRLFIKESFQAGNEVNINA